MKVHKSKNSSISEKEQRVKTASNHTEWRKNIFIFRGNPSIPSNKQLSLFPNKLHRAYWNSTPNIHHPLPTKSPCSILQQSQNTLRHNPCYTKSTKHHGSKIICNGAMQCFQWRFKSPPPLSLLNYGEKNSYYWIICNYIYVVISWILNYLFFFF